MRSPPDAFSAMAADVGSSPASAPLPLIVAESPGSSSSGSAPRRRLGKKCPRQPEFQPPPAPAEVDTDPVGYSDESGSEEEEDVGLLWSGLEARRDDPRGLYYKVRYRLKLFARRQLELPPEERMEEFDDKTYDTILGPWRRQCPTTAEIIWKVLTETKAPRIVKDWARLTWCDDLRDRDLEVQGKTQWLQGKQSLMTWNGDWGLVDPASVSDVGGDWRKMILQLSDLTQTKGLWKEFRAFVDGLVYQFYLVDWAVSLELCMETWENDRQKIRLHFHFVWKAQQRIRCRSRRPWVFRGAPPHVQNTVATLQTRVSGSWCGLYYLLCPKIGKLFSYGPKEPFRDFPVSGEWIFSMVQSQKMELEDARVELCRCGKGLVRKLLDLDKVRQCRLEAKLQERVSLVQAQIATQNKCFKTFDAVEAWKEEATKQFQRRKKFLVLAGRSGVGKTEYVRGLFGPQALLELNCANSACVPDLRAFDWETHKVILFDEACVEMVLKNRKLFQAPACLIDLGHSPTGRDVYRVFLNDAVLVIASNKWTDEVASLESASDRAWIIANQVLVVVTESMFQEDPAADDDDVDL